MKNIVLEKEVLNNCKIESVDLVKLLTKRGRKAFKDMSSEEQEDAAYNIYVNKCNLQKRPAMDRKTYDKMHEYYEFDELMSTDDVEEQDIKYSLESKATKKGYVGESFDFEAFDTLNKVFFKALKNRLIIILNLETVPGLVNTAITYLIDNQLDCKNINLALNAKLNELRKLLENAEVSKWLKSGVSDMSLYGSEEMLSDYISTYQRVLRSLTKIRDESLEYIKDIFHNDLDLFEDEILANDEPEIESFYEDEDSDEEDILD